MIFLSDHHSWNVLGLLVMTRRCLKETSCQTAEKTKRNWHKVRRRIVGMKSRQWLDAEWCDNVLIAVGKLSLPFHEGRGGGGGGGQRSGSASHRQSSGSMAPSGVFCCGTLRRHGWNEKHARPLMSPSRCWLSRLRAETGSSASRWFNTMGCGYATHLGAGLCERWWNGWRESSEGSSSNKQALSDQNVSKMRPAWHDMPR